MSKEKKAVTNKAVTKKPVKEAKAKKVESSEKGKTEGEHNGSGRLCFSCSFIDTAKCPFNENPNHGSNDPACQHYEKYSESANKPLTPEVLPKGEDLGALTLPENSAQIVKYQADAPVLTSIESSIKRDIQLAAKVDKAGAMIAIKIGLALDMAKRMIGHGFYEAWMKAKFGDIFSARRGQYYLKLAQKFQQTEYYRHLELPEKAEMGNYLAVSDESSDLGNAVSSFVGDLSINELMDKHGVKSKLPGGWHPADRDMEAFVRDYPELRGKPFDTWADADREKFKTWLANQQAGDMDFAKKMNAEGFWSKLTIDIMNKGLQEKTWGVIDNKMLTDLHHALGTLHKEIGKAIKTNEEK